ncbi:MAG: dihydropteroate synthase, partial [Planctomycetota bacterium]
DDLNYEDVVAEIRDYLIARRDQCVDQGIMPERVCLDPGIGFGKSHQQNLQLLRATETFVDLGSPLLIGHSRKGFIRKTLGDASADPLAGTLGVTLAVAAAGAHVVRVHDVAESVQALKLFRASRP